jgi:hypothetical protein
LGYAAACFGILSQVKSSVFEAAGAVQAKDRDKLALGCGAVAAACVVNANLFIVIAT